MQQRALASWLTGLSMALGVALVVSVLVIYGVVSDSFRRSAAGYDLIVGATKGGRLQIVLNTVYHLSAPVENIPYSYYKEFTQDEHHKGKFADYVQTAIPYCLGDSYEEFRVVGTTPQMFEEFEYAPGKTYAFAAGRNFEHEHFFEGVIGSIVARKTGLKLGDEFQPTHGVENDEQGHKHDAFEIVGILEPTGTPNDRALFVNMEGFYLLRGHARETPKDDGEASGGRQPPGDAGHREHDDHDAEHEKHEHAEEASGAKAHGEEHEADHDHEAHEHEAEKGERKQAADAHEDEDAKHEHDAKEHAHDEHEHAHADHDHDHDHAGHAHEHKPLPESQREVTAILVRTTPTNILANKTLQRLINKGRDAQAVQPAVEIFSLFDSIVSNLQLLLLVLGILVIAVAGIGIMVSIYNSMSDRRRDIAVMRSLGARRSTVMTIILLESILLSLGGGLGGFLLGHGLIGLASPWIVAQTGVSIGLFQFALPEVFLVPGLIVLASFVGFLPAMSAYGTDVAKALSSAP
ncbi:MAG TPA: ABC transporter permease [Pirellulales bacterium]|nr:ABC transporter permease [Pirellulales bacterium]